MWHDFTIGDYAKHKFFDVPQLGDRQFGLTLLETFPACAQKRWVPYYHFAIVRHGKDIGHLNFRVANSRIITEYDGHIGYRIFPTFRGFGYAAKACETLRPLLRLHKFSSVILTCNPDNLASRHTIENLGASLLEIKEFKDVPRSMDRLKCRYQWVL